MLSLASVTGWCERNERSRDHRRQARAGRVARYEREQESAAVRCVIDWSCAPARFVRVMDGTRHAG